MKMTLADARTRYQNLLTVANNHLPNKLAYGIAKNLMKLEGEVKLIEKQRVSIAESYAQKDENGAPVTENGNYVFGENEETFKKDFNEFLKTETDVHIHKVPCMVLDMLDDPRYDILTPAQMVALDFMVEYPETPEKTVGAEG